MNTTTYHLRSVTARGADWSLGAFGGSDRLRAYCAGERLTVPTGDR